MGRMERDSRGAPIAGDVARMERKPDVHLSCRGEAAASNDQRPASKEARDLGVVVGRVGALGLGGGRWTSRAIAGP